MFKTKILAVVFALSIVLPVSAFSWTTLGPHRKPVTLIVTANYKSPRLLAELIQNESRQPYLLLPAGDEGEQKIIFIPAKKNGAFEVLEADVNDFVRWLSPKRIIVLGNTDYVPQKYVDLLDKTIPVIRIEGACWARVADELDYMLNLSNLPTSFRKLSSELNEKGGVYRPISRPAKAEKLPADQEVK